MKKGCNALSNPSRDGEAVSSAEAAADPDSGYMRVAAGILAVALLICAGFGFWWCRGILTVDQWTELFKRHLPAMAGVPIATMLAFSVTLAARALGGPGAVEGWGIKFGGMAANALIWLLTFLATTLAIRMLW